MSELRSVLLKWAGKAKGKTHYPIRLAEEKLKLDDWVLLDSSEYEKLLVELARFKAMFPLVVGSTIIEADGTRHEKQRTE